MSSKNIVNPDHYTTGGRGKPEDRVSGGRHPVNQPDEKAQERWRARERDKKNREAGSEDAGVGDQERREPGS